MKRPADQMLGLMGLIAIGGSDFYPALTHQQKPRPNLTKLHALCEEYNLIQQKKSRLSASGRAGIVERVEYRVKKGHIVIGEDGRAGLSIIVR